ncbi:hypothetical protein ACET3Z_006810 [Daucus carota]
MVCSFPLSLVHGVLFISPIMHKLWIWRGTGSANFYLATAMADACFRWFRYSLASQPGKVPLVLLNA